MWIGLAGPNGAGKTECVRYLALIGFEGVSLSDSIREDLERVGRQPTRVNMIERGRQLRDEFGLGVLADRVARCLRPGREYVIDSIRHPAEVEVLRERGELVLVWIDAPEPDRFARVRSRRRAGDDTSLAAFGLSEAREAGSGISSAQQLGKVRALADYHISNDRELSALHERLLAVVTASRAK